MESIPKDFFSVNTAVVRCNKKPDRMANTTVGLLSAWGLIAGQGQVQTVQPRFNPLWERVFRSVADQG